MAPVEDLLNENPSHVALGKLLENYCSWRLALLSCKSLEGVTPASPAKLSLRRRLTKCLAVVGADASRLFHNYYAGACYTVRTQSQQYSTYEVNGRFAPGKPILEAPRAFAYSPFDGEDNVLYFGGFDANFWNATDRAWIFKAGVHTVVGYANRESFGSLSV